MGDGWISAGLEFGGAVLLAICGGYIKKHDDRLGKIEESQTKDHDDLSDVKLAHANYKLDVEKRYVNQETIQSTLQRLYSVLEEHKEESAKATSEMRNDIKNLIQAVASK